MKNEEFATAVGAALGATVRKGIRNQKGKVWMLLCAASFILHSLCFISCSAEDVTIEEYPDWQSRNNEAIDQWAANSSYRKIRTYIQDETAASKNSDFIYVEVLETGDGETSPIATDTVRVAYRGRLLPSTTYKEGYVFDQTYLGDFDWKTMGVAPNATAANFMQGFSTAVQNMHIGDRWRVYIPYTLMYGSASSTSYPAYSNMIFDIALVDYWPSGETRPTFRARMR